MRSADDIAVGTVVYWRAGDGAVMITASRADIEKVLQRAQIVWGSCREARKIVELEPSESARAVVNFQKMKEAELTRDPS